MKRAAALYLRVSTLDQHPETQTHDLANWRRSAALRSSTNIWIVVSAEPAPSGRA